MTRGEIINAFLTAAILVATAASAVIFYLQWQEMKGAGKQTADIIAKTGEQVAATNRLANSSDDTRNALVESERPWLGVVITMPPDLTKSGSGNVGILNTGRGAAFISNFRAYEKAYPALPDEPYYNTNPPFRNLLVPQEGTNALINTTGLNQDQMDVVASKKLTYFAYASVNYTDVRTGKSYWTRGCMYYNVEVKMWLACLKYNDAK